ncbi:hypothetical protein A3B18_00190 [Candidatus Giovannonibacteria bacterium RIFCSPLOWO2_01_FULL_46_13]|uniref:Uncharacterized protein n=1 Tax=Candidatus Giovannonibacteria bacterium RIFCSPLOWO2_01_FULL_46_13 TaxID=1798352 RepID=A0A1F5X385_9BACT|nr:MAG: hypothetical protein A3B18_00190 [Candidatus Giovannonibacteria bacterium RIFCSPLOWO2_01_FULL_46_13]
MKIPIVIFGVLSLVVLLFFLLKWLLGESGIKEEREGEKAKLVKGYPWPKEIKVLARHRRGNILSILCWRKEGHCMKKTYLWPAREGEPNFLVCVTCNSAYNF